MIISIASGKGGTGKTTVATNLVKSVEVPTRIIDCDVEEPNVHLFLRPEISLIEKVYTEIPKINQDACTGCRKCVEICRFRALTMVGDTVLVFPELCHSCGGCMLVCPEKAVLPGERQLGTIEFGTADTVSFVKGCLRIGEAMAPPLISKVREYAVGVGLTVLDAPPGTSCPVIAAMRGVDFVLLVTEPTPFGLHDLKLAVETVKILDIPFGLVINRAGLGDNGVYEYIESENIPLLLEIPFDVEIARAYSRGELLVEAFPEMKEQFATLYKDIVSIVQTAGGVQ